MEYYEETLLNIEKLLEEGREEEVRRIIEEELSQVYVPRDFEEKLHDVLKKLPPKERIREELSEEKIAEYLKSSPDHQLLAVSVLDKKNLRDHLKLCEDFLTSENGHLHAKVLLVDSLIRQEIGEEIRMSDETAEYAFIPKYLLPPEESDGFLYGIRKLEEAFLKEPSMFLMARDLLYKETILKLPVNLDKEEGEVLAEDIEKFIRNAFNEGEDQ